MKIKIMTVLTVISLAVMPGAMDACCMVPRGHDVVIGQKTQEALIMHHEGREELILRINYNITKKKESATLPGYFAWIITVPNEPDSYKVADKDLFSNLFSWAEKNARPKKRLKNSTRSLGAVESKAFDASRLQFSKKVKVGPYDIQPIKALGLDALEGLNKWLGDNGFPTEDPLHMKWFVENKFTFLAIKVSAAEGEKSVSEGGDLPPMHLSFKSEKPYYPLRFSSRQGIFDLNLYMMTTNRFDYEKSSEALKKLNYRNTGYLRNVKCRFEDSLLNFSPILPKSVKNIWKDSKVENRTTWYLNVLRTRKVNSTYPISKWKDDVFFPIDA